MSQQIPPIKPVWQDAVRILSVEFIQNWPVLAGILLALTPLAPPILIFLIPLGAGLSAFLIGSTDSLKYAQRPGPIALRDLVNNTTIFSMGGLFYLAYYRLIRTDYRWPLDVVFGLALGLLVGLLQSQFVDERRMTKVAFFHMLGLGFAGGLVLTLVGAFAATYPPVLSATLLDCIMTVIIVWMDYRRVLGSGSQSRVV